jgi:hypothetical protein
MKPRPPKPDDLAVLRRLYAAAGSRAELLRWLDLALKEGRKRQQPHDDKPSLLAAWLYARAPKARGIKPWPAVKEFVELERLVKKPGCIFASGNSVEADQRRLYEGLKKITVANFHEFLPERHASSLKRHGLKARLDGGSIRPPKR